MFEYNFSGKTNSVKTPKYETTSELKIEIFEQTPSFLHQRTTFPNGLIIEIEQTSSSLKFLTNKEIKVTKDGSLTLDY